MANNELFAKLSQINVNDKIEKKEGLSYLSWTDAFYEFAKSVGDFEYDIEPYTYDENLGYMVYTHISVNGQTKRMWLPVMDSKNKAMKNHDYKYSTMYGEKVVKAATMTDINKTYMRCLVKNMAMFGLGLYIYRGEDMPMDETQPTKESVQTINNDQFQILKEKFSVEQLKNIQRMYKIKNFATMSVDTFNEILTNSENKEYYG